MESFSVLPKCTKLHLSVQNCIEVMVAHYDWDVPVFMANKGCSNIELKSLMVKNH